LAALWVTLSWPAGAQQNPEQRISQLIDPARPGAVQLHSGSEVREFYRYREFAPAWTVETQASEAIVILRDAGSDGLDPAAFRLGSILADRKASTELKAAEFDVLLTDAMLSYIRQISGSRVIPAHVSKFIALPSPVVPAPEVLEGSLAANTLQSLPDKLAPPHPEYAFLKRGLAHYRGEGSKSARVAQIIANMERWRWLPRPFGDSYVEVNSADATLKLVKGNEIVFSTRLVTGRPSTPTPLLETTINAVTIDPSWDIPGDIAIREILPKAQRHPGYLESHHIVGDRPGGALRQMPGPGNPLGRFLLEMPNSFDAYLHDTPQKNLFGKSDRHLSHGCMRVENMAALVSRLLAEDGAGSVDAGSVDDVQSVPDSGETQTLPLSRPVPVYVLYWTVVPRANGSLEFHRDVYGWDSAVLAALKRPVPSSRDQSSPPKPAT
jgi:murein L,D-transpeptidase YcbB/YkuD